LCIFCVSPKKIDFCAIIGAEGFVRGAKKAAGTVELDLGRYELRRAGQRVPLEKKPMELLILLVGRRDQMVSREDIVRKLWRSDLFIDT
jgi:DNA-binding winged helix-turn-helix (wHTH) protein